MSQDSLVELLIGKVFNDEKNYKNPWILRFASKSQFIDFKLNDIDNHPFIGKNMKKGDIKYLMNFLQLAINEEEND